MVDRSFYNVFTSLGYVIDDVREFVIDEKPEPCVVLGVCLENEEFGTDRFSKPMGKAFQARRHYAAEPTARPNPLFADVGGSELTSCSDVW
jgi:hypothetical protein